MDGTEIQELRDASKRMRKTIVDMTYNVGNVGAHVGGALSLVEILAMLYLREMNIDAELLQADDRDRLILSKGHGVMAVYAAMKEKGIISEEEISTFKQDGTRLSAHPAMNADIGIDFASGSLGQGLSLGVGVCLALRMKGNDTSKVFVIVGDGECDEGQIWEAAMTAAHYHLSNLVCIVDRNHLQYDGVTEEVKDKSNLAEIWKGCRWDVAECDGHDFESLENAFQKSHGDGPLAIIADTVKGKGVSYMENNPAFHNGRINEKQYEQAISEIEAA